LVSNTISLHSEATRRAIARRECIPHQLALNLTVLRVKQVDRDDVEAEGSVVSLNRRQGPTVGVGHTPQHALFATVYGGGCGGHVASAASFDFYEADLVAFPGDEVQIAIKFRGPPAPLDDLKPLPPEEKQRLKLAAFTGEEVGRTGGLAGRPGGQGLQPQQRRALNIDTDELKPPGCHVGNIP
jgi:hypothetical protein